MHESAISCLKWLKWVKTAKLQLHFRQKAWLSSVFSAAVKHVKYKNSQEAGSTKMLLLVYLLGVTAQFRVGCAEPGWNKSFAPLSCSSVHLPRPVMDFIMDLEIISSSRSSEMSQTSQRDDEAGGEIPACEGEDKNLLMQRCSLLPANTEIWSLFFTGLCAAKINDCFHLHPTSEWALSHTTKIPTGWLWKTWNAVANLRCQN